MISGLQDPCAKETFEASKLDWTDAERNSHTLDLHRDLLRSGERIPSFHPGSRGEYDAAVLTDVRSSSEPFLTTTATGS